MSVKYIPARPTPPGYLHYQDVVRAIEAEGFRATGWHYSAEPTVEEIAYKSRTFYGGAELIAREVVGTGSRGWTLFMRPETPVCLPVGSPPPGSGWVIESGNTEFNKWVRS